MRRLKNSVTFATVFSALWLLSHTAAAQKEAEKETARPAAPGAQPAASAEQEKEADKHAHSGSSTPI